MVTRFIDAIEKSTGIVRDTEVITNDSLVDFNIPTIFPGLDPGLYNFQARSELTPDYEVTNPLPTITGAPTVSGTIRTGQTLTANPAPVTGNPIPTRTWQWQRLVSGSWSNIAGATAGTYVLTAADEGMSVRVRQTETNVGGTASADSTPIAVPFLLDQLTAVAAGAYSFRKLSAAANLANRMRRNSDQAEQDFGFTASGDFDQAAFDTFVSASTAALGRTWYDQSPAGVHYQQPTTSRQMLARNASANIQTNGKPAFYAIAGTGTSARWFERPSFLFQAGKATGFLVIRDQTASSLNAPMHEYLTTAGNAGARYEIRNENNGNAGFEIRNDAGSTIVLNQGLGTGMLTTTANILAFRDTGTNIRGFNNGVGGANINYTRTGAYTFDRHIIGSDPRFGAASCDCYFSEVIWFTTDISNEDLNTIIASQGGEYGITVQPFLTDEENEYFGTQRDGVFGKRSDNWQGYTGNIARSDEGNGGVGFPQLYRMRFINTANGANRVTASRDILSNFDSFEYPHWDGGNVRVFRVTNGVMSQVRQSTVIGGKIGKWNWLKRNQDLTLSGTTLTDLLSDASSTLGQPYFYRVAAVDASGNIGAWSTNASYTPANLSGSAATVHPPLSAIPRRSGTSGLAAPTGVAVAAGTIARQAVITWNAVSGASGYVVERAYQTPTTWTWIKQNTDRVFVGNSHRFVLDTFNRPNVPYWFRVAAVGADGLSGAWSTPASFTPTSLGGSVSGIATPVGTTVRTGSGGALLAPSSVSTAAGTSDREVVISWSAVAGAEGYIVEQTYYDPATEIDTTEYLDLSSDPTPLLAGDLIILENQFLTVNDNLFCSRVFSTGAGEARAPTMLWFDNEVLKRDGRDWSFVAYSGDKPAGVVGDHFFRRTAPAGQSALMRRYWHSGTAQTFYRILEAGKTYRMRCIMRASSPVTVTFGPGAVPGVSSAVFDNVPSTWTEYTYDMVPTSQRTDGTPSDWQMTFTAGGSTTNLDIALFEIREVGAPLATLVATPMPPNSYIRDISFIKPGANNRSMLRIAGGANYSFKAFYDILMEQGAKPWLQIEWNTPKEDVLNFVAYLAAPNGTHPFAELRQNQGIPEPWTTTFSDIRVEFGNEAWNNFPGFWTFPGNMTDSATGQVYIGGPTSNQGEVAGLFWQMMSNWMKESPYWPILEPKVTQHLGGATAGSFGAQAYRYYQDAKEVSTAPYNGGWESGSTRVKEDGQSFNVVLTDSLMVQKPRAIARTNELRSVCQQIGKVYGVDVRPDIYEAGPGYQNSGLTTAEVIAQEVVMKSRASAAATVDTMLITAQQGFKSWSFFTVSRGNFWSSHAPAVDGGQEYMVNALPRIIHQEMAPCDVWGALTAPIGLKTGETSGGTTAQINQIGAYQLRNLSNPSKRMLVLINRNIDPSQLDPTDPRYSATPSGTVAFNITTTWTGATSLKAWTAGVGPYRQHNRYPPGQRAGLTAGTYVSDPLCVSFNYTPVNLSLPGNIQNFPINASVGATANGLPAGNVLLLLFEGVTGG